MNYQKHQRIKIHKEVAKVITGDIKRDGKTYKRKAVMRKMTDIRSRRLK